MVVLVTCKFDDDIIKNEGPIVFITFSPLKVPGKMFHRSRASYSKSNGWNWPKIELNRDFITVFVTCKFDKDPIKNEVLTEQHFLHYKSKGKIFVTQGQVTPMPIVRSGPKSILSAILISISRTSSISCLSS